MTAIRPATPEDVPPLAKILASAFAKDPFVEWMLGEERLSPSVLTLLYGKLVSLNLAHRHVFTNEERSAVAVWRPPERCELGMGEELSMLGTMLRTMGGARLVRLLPQLLAVEKRHPKGAYAKLVVLGVDPVSQGRGLAGRLLRQALADCDARGTASYLETSKEGNLALYERFGFRVTDVFSIPKGPNVWFMWRDANANVS